MSDLVLASRSPARARLLQDAGLSVRIQPSPLDEASAKAALVAGGVAPRELAIRLAEAKALAVAASPGELVLGADQTLELDASVFDKSQDLATLRRQLDRLQGRTHHLHAAAALVRDRELVWAGHSTVSLRMRRLTGGEMDDYVANEGRHVLDCVGGYRLEGPGVRLFEAIEGEYFAVLGLPLLALLAALRPLGIGR